MKFDPERFPDVPPPAFENAEYDVRITYTEETDRRIMSFVDYYWGVEITGGVDQFESLIVLNVERYGFAYRAGLRPGDKIIKINKLNAEYLTLMEAQEFIRHSGKSIKFVVHGEDIEEDKDVYADFWFKPRNKIVWPDNKWEGFYYYNDKRKKPCKESNCFMVPSKAETHIKHIDPNAPKIIIPPVEEYVQGPFSAELTPEPTPDREIPHIIPTISDENTVIAEDNSKGIYSKLEVASFVNKRNSFQESEGFNFSSNNESKFDNVF